jgi:hypothetical protein
MQKAAKDPNQGSKVELSDCQSLYNITKIGLLYNVQDLGWENLGP